MQLSFWYLSKDTMLSSVSEQILLTVSCQILINVFRFSSLLHWFLKKILNYFFDMNNIINKRHKKIKLCQVYCSVSGFFEFL